MQCECYYKCYLGKTGKKVFCTVQYKYKIFPSIFYPSVADWICGYDSAECGRLSVKYSFWCCSLWFSNSTQKENRIESSYCNVGSGSPILKTSALLHCPVDQWWQSRLVPHVQALCSDIPRWGMKPASAC